ncbi:hypothetical protein BJV74DRAFT_843291 [Russula compacta]|nr:hypothetical protein BJV74DRAFT_843291 [Russula compacta]
MLVARYQVHGRISSSKALPVVVALNLHKLTQSLRSLASLTSNDPFLPLLVVPMRLSAAQIAVFTLVGSTILPFALAAPFSGSDGGLFISDELSPTGTINDPISDVPVAERDIAANAAAGLFVRTHDMNTHAGRHSEEHENDSHDKPMFVGVEHFYRRALDRLD